MASKATWTNSLLDRDKATPIIKCKKSDKVLGVHNSANGVKVQHVLYFKGLKSVYHTPI